MIISRTPFRTSFIGGGTDLAAFCDVEPGAVISCAIQKYIYVTAKRQMPIADYKYRISWNKLEFTNEIEEIEHPIIREALKMFDIDYPLEITTFADVPSQTGLGSSSSFTVGLLNVLHALRRERVSKGQLAREAAELEINRLGRKIGTQDHYAAAYGDFNIFRFYPNLRTSVTPVLYKAERVTALEQRLLLFYTRKTRDAGELLAVQSQEMSQKQKFDSLKQMLQYIQPLEETLTGGRPLDDFGEILHTGWMLKKQLSSLIADQQIDEMYSKARAAGAIGGKLLGAGGGGFLLVYVRPEQRQQVMQAMNGYFCLPVRFDTAGSRITYFDSFSL
ncbi:hypothetical protein [Rheinheimera texasensis]|uniref:GHMP family kinase ATP-binding protein n=1 Tax=Rheinheimera texasensis TaxID=306205 RepID=UPI0004E14B04|nr:hypothetical protein [Rheinheimera texasensis]